MNPVDLLSDATPEQYKTIVTSCLNDDNVDGVLVILVPSLTAMPKETGAVVAAAAVADIYQTNRYSRPGWRGVGCGGAGCPE